MAKWKTMAPARNIPLHPTRRREIEQFAAKHGIKNDELAQLIQDHENAETWMNNLYVATVMPAAVWHESWPQMRHLSIRRIDRKPIHDWRHLQQIKTDIFGDHAEAVELYPASARVVDTANSYHLWVLTEAGMRFPFGWAVGLQTDENPANIPGQQRPGVAKSQAQG